MHPMSGSSSRVQVLVTRPLHLNVADVARRPGTRRALSLRAVVADLAGPSASVRGPVEVEGDVEGIREGVIVHADVRAHVTSECSRCLTPVDGLIEVEVREVFEDSATLDAGTEGEIYPLHQDELDLEPMVRDAVLPELPAVPLCRPDCAGLCPVCGENRNETACDCTLEEADPRWSALRELKF
jgi:uncharacterized protein